MHITSNVYFDTFFCVCVSLSWVRVADDKYAIFQQSLNFALRPLNMNGSAGLRRCSDQIVNSSAAVLELEQDSLMIDNVVIAPPDAAPKRIICTEALEFFFRIQPYSIHKTGP
jgi:hypothetical protein